MIYFGRYSMKSKPVICDERIMKLRGEAATFTLKIIIVFLIIESVFRIIKGKELDWRVVVVLCLCIFVPGIYLSIKGESINIPVDFRGRPLPLGKDKNSRIKRFISYIITSLMGTFYAIVFNYLLFKIYSNNFSTAITFFISFLVVNYLSYEGSVKKAISKNKEYEY